MKLARCISIMCFLSCGVFVWPLLAQVGDAVSVRDLQRVEQRLDRHDGAIDAINAKMNWMLGGIGVLFGMMGLMNVQMRISAK